MESQKKLWSFPTLPEDVSWTGERFVTRLAGEVADVLALTITYEHYHRYLFAIQFCAGRKVLDVACGTGYGSHMISNIADSVKGVDIAQGVIDAATKSYGTSRLEFLVADCLSLPFEDASFDVVVSFETIEHIMEHKSFLSEIKRVMKSGGLLIISSPEKKVYSASGNSINPYHLKELSYPEFRSLIEESFSYANFGAQRVLLGSSIFPIEENGTISIFEHQGGWTFRNDGPEVLATYICVVCSSEKIPVFQWSFLNDGRTFPELQNKAVLLEEELAKRIVK